MGALDNSSNIIPFYQPSLQDAMPLIYRTPVPEFNDTAPWQSYLNTPVYSNLIFDSGQGQTFDLPLRIDTVLFSVDQQKIVVATEIPNRKDARGNEIGGTIKEYIGLGDYKITIQGAIVSPLPNQFPKYDLSYFNELMKLPKSLKVTSDFLNMFSISYITIIDVNVSEKMGSRNMVPFTIFALSDNDPSVNDSGYYQT